MNRIERRLRDQQIVDAKLPSNTKFLIVDDVDGWLYTVRDELGSEWKFYLYFDYPYYKVKLVAPELEAAFKSAHEGHLFRDGKVCLSKEYDAGMPTLESAYSKSVVWALGITILKKTGEFPF